MELEKLTKEEMRKFYLFSRYDDVNIGIERVTFSFPIEDIGIFEIHKLTESESESPKHSRIDVSVKGRKVYISYPLAQLFGGLFLPLDKEDYISSIKEGMHANLAQSKCLEIKSFDNMEIEKLHLMQLVNVEGDILEIMQFQEWLYGRYNGAFHQLEETEDLLNGGKVRRLMDTFSVEDEYHWKSLAREMYIVQFNVILENVQSIKEAFGDNKLESLDEESLQKVMQQNAKAFFDSLGYIHPLVRILESLDIIDQEMRSVWKRAASMKYPDSYEDHFPEEYHDTVKIYEENVKNLKELRRFITYLTRGLVDPLGELNSILKLIEKLGQELVGPEFSFELRY